MGSFDYRRVKTQDMLEQLESLPSEASVLVVSIGGNDALRYLPLLDMHVSTVGEALLALNEVVRSFVAGYRLGTFSRGAVIIMTIPDASCAQHPS